MTRLLLAVYLGCLIANWSPPPTADPITNAVLLVTDTNAQLIGTAYLLTGHHFPITCQDGPWMAAVGLLVGGIDTDC